MERASERVELQCQALSLVNSSLRDFNSEVEIRRRIPYIYSRTVIGLSVGRNMH